MEVQPISPFKGIRRNAFSLVLTSWKIEFPVPLNSSHKTCSLIWKFDEHPVNQTWITYPDCDKYLQHKYSVNEAQIHALCCNINWNAKQLSGQNGSVLFPTLKLQKQFYSDPLTYSTSLNVSVSKLPRSGAAWYSSQNSPFSSCGNWGICRSLLLSNNHSCWRQPLFSNYMHIFFIFYNQCVQIFLTVRAWTSFGLGQPVF